jgi:Arc/MetJ-type ribon-helix-helix transcriptional regulator
MKHRRLTFRVDDDLLRKVDSLVRGGTYESRSHAVRDALLAQLPVMMRERLVRECAKLDPEEEVALAEEGFSADTEQWCKY